MTYDTIRVEDHENILILYFNRPEKLNAVNARMYTELSAFLDDVGSAAALILTGEGRAFMAGADIGPYTEMSLQEFTAFQRLGRSVMEKIERLACPVIAAVNGYAFGGGFEIALAADIILQQKTPKSDCPEPSSAFFPAAAAHQPLPRLSGRILPNARIMRPELINQ